MPLESDVRTGWNQSLAVSMRREAIRSYQVLCLLWAGSNGYRRVMDFADARAIKHCCDQ
jgi:hypothetical protein